MSQAQRACVFWMKFILTAVPCVVRSVRGAFSGLWLETECLPSIRLCIPAEAGQELKNTTTAPQVVRVHHSLGRRRTQFVPLEGDTPIWCCLKSLLAWQPTCQGTNPRRHQLLCVVVEATKALSRTVTLSRPC